MAHTVQLRCIEIPVSDLQRAKRWYQSALAFEETWSDGDHALLSTAAADPSAVQLLLVKTSDPARLAFRSSSTGVEHSVVDFNTQDLEALHRELRAAGEHVEELGPPSSDWAPRGFSFFDPDGNRLGAFSYSPR